VAVALNKLCEIEDWALPGMAETMCRLMPDLKETLPLYPFGYEHRKVWEYAHVLLGLDKIGALRPDAFVLSVGAGHEEPLYDLTNRVRWVFATDIYGQGNFMDAVAPSSMLIDPDRHGRCPYNRNRLVVQHMSALDLRFEPSTFDIVYSFSTIEHVGTLQDIHRAVAEIQRVLKPGGIAVITTECIVNQAPQLECPGLCLFQPDTLRGFGSLAEGLRLIEPIDFSISRRTLANPPALIDLMEEWKAGRNVYPLVAEQYEGRVYTSACMFFRKY
jgi:SAM-dependent methyltransferase